MGKLIVTVLGCRNLKNTDTIGKSDPYVIVRICAKKFQTKTVNNNLDPDFNEQFNLFVANPAEDKLELQVMDADTFKDELIGEVSIFPLSELHRGQVVEHWLEIHQKDPGNETTGKVGVQLLAEDFGLETSSQQQQKKENGGCCLIQ